MAKRLFRLYTDDEDLIKDLESKHEISAYLESIANKVRTDQLVEPQDLDYENKLKAAKLKKLEAEAKIKTWEADHLETFDKPASPQAKKAIIERVLTQNEIGNVEKYITLHVNGTGFEGKCDFCKLGITEGTRERTLLECTRHLIACHRKEILKIE